MRYFVNVAVAATAGALVLLTSAPVADACSRVSLKANIRAETCCERLGPNGEKIFTEPAFLVWGTLTLKPGRQDTAPLILANLVMEVQTRQGGTWVTQKRLVLNQYGDSSVETCLGELAQTEPATLLRLLDADNREISFAEAQALRHGKNEIGFVGTFRGPLAALKFTGKRHVRNKRVRVRAFATLIGEKSRMLCSVDADGDGVVEHQVSTHLKYRTGLIKENWDR